MDNVHFSSKVHDWQTPTGLIDDLAEVFKWNIDVCASTNNVCDNYFDVEIDGLSQEWAGLCWMNPPYGRDIAKWMRKAANSVATVVCLVPARTDTRWWHDHIEEASYVVFIKGRLYFGKSGKEGNAPFPSAFIVFGTLFHDQRVKLEKYGWAVK